MAIVQYRRVTVNALVSWVFVALGLSGCSGDPAPPGGMDSGMHDGGTPTDLSCLELIPLRLWTTDPSAVAMLYRIETCAGETVVFDPGAGESVFDYYTLTENGSTLSSEAVPDIDRSERQRAYVNLLLDFSESTRPVEAELLQAARTFVGELLTVSDRVYVGIQIFDGRPAPITIELPTRNLDRLRATIAGLAGYSDPAADRGSTDLHGAVRTAVTDLQARQDLVIRSNDGGLVTTGYVVAFTDGRDTSERVTASDAASTVAAGRAAHGTDGASSNVQTYAVALEGADYTAEARANLLTVLGAERYLYEGSLSELEAQFETLARRIADQAQATHLLKYCSAARSGSRHVELGILPSRGTARSTIAFDFSADGFGPGCSDFIRTICVGRSCGGFNCGGCDDESQVCVAATGECRGACLESGLCSGETITTALGYELVCTADRCAATDAGPPTTDGGVSMTDGGDPDGGTCECPAPPPCYTYADSSCPCAARMLVCVPGIFCDCG